MRRRRHYLDMTMGLHELDGQVSGWRREQLRASGFPVELARRLAVDDRFDLHLLIELVERGCPPHVAVRILAPLEAS